MTYISHLTPEQEADLMLAEDILVGAEPTFDSAAEAARLDAEYTKAVDAMAAAEDRWLLGA